MNLFQIPGMSHSGGPGAGGARAGGGGTSAGGF